MIKVLVICMDTEGVGYHRIYEPYLSMHEPDIDITFFSNTDYSFRFDENTLRNFNVIVYHKGIPFRSQDEAVNFPIILRKYGIKTIYDIDDHWILHSSHVNYKQWKKNNSSETTIQHIKQADAITTTTAFFASEISKLNKFVYITPNSLNHKEFQWNQKKIPSEKIRFMWSGGITHLPDLLLMKDSFKAIDANFREKSQLYLCGFDLRIKTQNGTFVDDPNRNQWGKFEDIFTDNGRHITNPEYLSWLRTYDEVNRMSYGKNEKFVNEFYQRRFTKPVFTYMTHYQEADICLAPLKDGVLFNSVKSNLKCIESGAYHCPLIASNVESYKYDIKDGFNGFLISENDRLGWYNKMKFFVDNPNAVTDMGENNYQWIMEHYELSKVNQIRIDLIRELANELPLC